MPLAQADGRIAWQGPKARSIPAWAEGPGHGPATNSRAEGPAHGLSCAQTRPAGLLNAPAGAKGIVKFLFFTNRRFDSQAFAHADGLDRRSKRFSFSCLPITHLNAIC